MNRKFKAPPSVDIKQWAKVEFLSRHGFRFGSIIDKEGHRVTYPSTLEEAREFVRKHTNSVGAGWLPEEASSETRVPGRKHKKSPRGNAARRK